MNQRKHEHFKDSRKKDTEIPNWFALLIIVGMLTFIIFLAIDKMKPKPKDTSHYHISNPQIFNE